MDKDDPLHNKMSFSVSGCQPSHVSVKLTRWAVSADTKKGTLDDKILCVFTPLCLARRGERDKKLLQITNF